MARLPSDSTPEVTEEYLRSLFNPSDREIRDVNALREVVGKAVIERDDDEMVIRVLRDQLPHLESPEDQAACRMSLGFFFMESEPEEAIGHFSAAETAYVESGSLLMASSSIDTLSKAYVNAGKRKEALESLERSARYYTEDDGAWLEQDPEVASQQLAYWEEALEISEDSILGNLYRHDKNLLREHCERGLAGNSHVRRKALLHSWAATVET